ncbi:MAG TPA: LysR substrate-binding domain-containing protein [Caulobacteraceae bacterium]
MPKPYPGAMAANYQHLRAFHAIAREGSVTRAARRLNVAQPTLSQQLKALETKHGVQLFESRRSPLQLSAAGKDLLALTERLFGAAAQIDEMLEDTDRLAGATLCLGADSPPIAVRIVKTFRKHNPRSSVLLRMGNAREVMHMLADAQVDAAVVSDPPGDAAFHYDPLYSDVLWCALPLSHRLTAHAVVSVNELSREILLNREPTSKTRAFTERAMAAANIEPLKVLELQSREAIREGVALGLGVGVFFSAECPPDRRIAYRPLDLDEPAYRLQVYLICLRDQRRSAMMRSLRALSGEIDFERRTPLREVREPAAAVSA